MQTNAEFKHLKELLGACFQRAGAMVVVNDMFFPMRERHASPLPPKPDYADLVLTTLDGGPGFEDLVAGEAMEAVGAKGGLEMAIRKVEFILRRLNGANETDALYTAREFLTYVALPPTMTEGRKPS